MRVIMQGRSARSIALSPGGDQVKLELTAEALRRGCDVDVTVSPELQPDVSAYDVVHLFGITRPQEVWVQMRNARRQGKPVVLSTIYLDVWEYERAVRDDFVGVLSRLTSRNVSEAVKAGGRAAKSREWHRGVPALFYRGFRSMQLDVAEQTSLFLPDSHSEWRRCVDDLGLQVPDERVAVIPNGVTIDDIHPEGPVPDHLKGFEGCILCVARLEARKNQLALVEALRDTGLTLVLAGQPAPNQPAYARRVEEAAGPNVHVLGSVSRSDRDWLYRLASVHVLPSWLETTGLSSLEAAVRDCSIVVSPNGDTEEYFGDDALYCDPSSAQSIRDAVVQAAERPPSERLKRRILDEMTWTRVAEETAKAYQRVVR